MTDKLFPVFIQGQDNNLEEPDHFVNRADKARYLSSKRATTIHRGKALLLMDTCLPQKNEKMDQEMRSKSLRDSCAITGPHPSRLSTPERPRYSLIERYMLSQFSNNKDFRALFAVNGWKRGLPIRAVKSLAPQHA